jgi:hypothetical protein
VGDVHLLRALKVGGANMQNDSHRKRIQAWTARFPGTSREHSRFSGMASTRLILHGSAVILVGMSACGAQVGTTSSPSASLTPCSQDQAFSLSLAKDTGGETSPIAAAQWFAAHGGVWSDIPTTGWSVTGSAGSSTSVQSGSFTLEVLQGPDGTWQVASGTDAAC